MDHLCRSHSVLPATDQLLHSPAIAPEAPLLSQLPVRGLLQMWEPLLSFSSPTRGTGSIPLPFLFFFSSSFFHPTLLLGGLSCPFRCPSSSVSVQLVLCEKCSICRCILDAFVGRDEFHILLLLHHLVACLFILFILSFTEQKSLILIKSS